MAAIRAKSRKLGSARRSESAGMSCAGVLGAALGAAILWLTPASVLGQAASTDDWQVDPIRGPVDLGLTDPSLIGAIDVHLHLDPDAPGTGGVIRAVDVFDAAKIAMSRGMRGFVFKTHQDTGSASICGLSCAQARIPNVRDLRPNGIELFDRRDQRSDP